MSLSELRDCSSEQLQTELLNLLKEQFSLRMQQGLDNVQRPDQFKKVRRKIAQVKTIIRERGY